MQGYFSFRTANYTTSRLYLSTIEITLFIYSDHNKQPLRICRRVSVFYNQIDKFSFNIKLFDNGFPLNRFGYLRFRLGKRDSRC